MLLVMLLSSLNVAHETSVASSGPESETGTE